MPLDNAGNDFVSSKQINTNPLNSNIQSFNDWVGGDDLKDVYSFTLLGRSSVNLNLESLQDDANFRLLDSKGGEIGKSFNKGTTLDSIKNKVLDRGSYYIEVIPFSSTTNTFYNLQVSTVLQNNTAGNTLTTAKSLTLDATQKSFYDWAGVGQAVDFYSIEADIGSELNLQLKGLKENADIQLLDDQGNILQKSANAGTAAENIKYTFQKAANYYLKVEATANANTDYELAALLKASLTPTVTVIQDTDGASLSTPSNININSIASTISQTLGGVDANDYYRFTLNDPSNLNVKLEGLTGDANIQLLDSNGQILANSENLGTTSESISQTLAKGTYYLRAFANTTNTINYNLINSATILPPDTDGSIANAKQITLDSNQVNYLNSVGTFDTNDYYKFNLTNRSHVNFNLDGLSGDANLQLLDNLGNIIKVSENLEITGESISQQLDVGSYYLRVYPNSNASTINYTLSTQADIDSGDTLATAKDITINSVASTISEKIGGIDADDYFRFTLNDPSNLNVKLEGLTGDANIQLLDSNGQILANSENPGTTSESISQTLAKGTYYLRAFANTTNSINYNLINTATILPADTDGTLANAKQITLDSTQLSYVDSVSNFDTNDYYKFNVTNLSNVNLNLNGLSADVDLQLLDNLGNVIKVSENLHITGESISQQLDVGTYYLRVYPKSITNASIISPLNYTLSTQASIVPVDAGNTIATAKDITVNSVPSTISETVGGTDTNDYFRFTLNDSSNLSVKLEGLTADANIHLLDSNGKTIGKSETGGTASESISQTLLKGSYYLRVFPNVGGVISYKLTTSSNPLPPDADGSLALAKQITVDGTSRSYQDSVGTFDPNDYYKFNLTSLSNVNINLGGLNSDANLYLLDSVGNVVKRSENGGTIAESITQQLGAGTYHIRVFPNSNTSTINYTLSTQTSAATVDSDGTTATARNLAVSSTKLTISDSIGGADTNDYYKFSLTNAAQLNLTLDGLTADSNVQLLDSNASVIQTSANTVNTAETISRQLNSGTYYVRVYPNGSITTNYNLNISTTSTSSTSSTTANTLPNFTTITSDPDGKLEVAKNITVDSTKRVWSDSVGPTDLHDYSRFSLKDKSIFQLSLYDLTSDAHVELLDSKGKIVQGSYIGGRVTETIARKLDAGDYFIRVFPNSGVNINYKLSTQATIFTPSANNNDAWFTNNIKDLGIRNLATSLAADGNFSRNDIISILREAKDNGEVNTDELVDLKAIINIDNNLVEIQGYIRNLASKVIGSNPANQKYQGGILGDLKAGSSDVQMEKLINKWFFGGDRPKTLDSNHVYSAVSGSLFQNGVSYLDVKQGLVGDCYFMVALTSIAHKKPEYIENMFIDNGDNTYTVRFYNYGVADYVTVDNYLPTKDGKLVYGNAGNVATSSSNELWAALAEKAYAQLNELDWIWRDGTNTYLGIEAGRMYEPIEQITGRTAYIDYVSDLTQQKLIDLTNSPQLTTAAFVYGGGYGVVDGHAYTIISYDPTQGTFYLHNPWGTNHANVNWQQLTQLQAEFEITYA
jgi:hypothetical protein